MLKKAVCFLSIVSFPLIGAAEKRALSLEEAVRIGIENSPKLHASLMNLESAAAISREQAAARLPSLKFGAGYARLREVPPFELALPFAPDIPLPASIIISPSYSNSYTLSWSVRQPLFTGFRLQAGVEASRSLEESAGQDHAREKDEFIFAVKSAYWNLAGAREFEKVIGESIGRFEAHLKDVKAFFDQGLLTRNDVLRVDVQLSNAKYARIEAAGAMELASIRLNSLLGLPLDTEVDLVTTVESQAAGLPAEEVEAGESSSAWSILRSALAGRPDLLSAAHRIKTSEAGVKASRADWFPQVYLSAGYYYLRPNPRLLPIQDKFYGTWDIGITLSFDVWNWGRTKQRTKQASVQLAAARDALKLLEDGAVLEVAQGRLNLKQAREKIVVSDQAVGQAEENLRVTRERFKQGVALSTEVLDAEVALLQAGMNKTRAAIELVLAQAGLEKALGR